MLDKINTLVGYTLQGSDGKIGEVKQFYFDDEHWAIRYLVADTGRWLPGRQVLLSPYALLAVDKKEHHISVDLTKKQIENSPSLDSHKPVSRQFEASYYGYYGWPAYWGDAYMWGAYPYLEHNRENWKNYDGGKKAGDAHLRSTQEVTGYHVQALDGEIGHIDDLIVDDATWAIRYFVIKTHNWWPGNKVLVSPQWIDRLSWSDSKVVVNLSRESVKRSPKYTEASLINQDYETELHKHYGRQGHWVGETVAKR